MVGAPFHYLVLGTFESETNAERFVSGMGMLRESVQIRPAIEPSGLAVFRITAGAFEQSLTTRAMRDRLGLDSTDFPDAYAVLHDDSVPVNPEALRLQQKVMVRVADEEQTEGYYHLVVFTTPSNSEAKRVVESLDTLKSQAKIVEMRHAEVRTVYKVAIGRFKEPYHTFRLRAYYGLRDDQFADAYTEQFIKN
jgi:hypothetical protein